MKKNILVLPCNNGLGHVVRCVILSNELCKNHNVHLVLDKSKKKSFKINKKIKIINLKLNSDLAAKKNYNLEKRFEIFYKKKFDLVLSDNLIEPIFSDLKVILFCNFFWHDIFKSHDIKKLAIKTVQQKKIPILRNYLIHYKKYKNSIFIPFYGKFNKKLNIKKENLLISFGTSNLKNKIKLKKLILKNIYQFKFKKIYVDKDIYFFLRKRLKNLRQKNSIYLAKYDKKMFNSVTTAIVKPGLGIVRDCLSESIKIVVPKINFNDEFKNTSKILFQNKLAIIKNSFYESIKYCSKYVSNDEEKVKYYKRCKNLKWNGEIFAKKYIIKFLSKI